MKYFNRYKFRKVIVNKTLFNKFRDLYPEYKNYPDKYFSDLWRILILETNKEILFNIAGVDLPLYLGNLSVRVLDIEFKGHLDIPQSAYNKRMKMPGFVFTSQRVKLVWKKHILFKAIFNVMGVEVCKKTRQHISKGVKGRENFYQKAYKHDKIVSKHKDVKETQSLLDLA